MTISLTFLAPLLRPRSKAGCGVVSHANHYNNVRTNRSQDKDAPRPRSVQRIGRIVSRPSSANFTINTRVFEFSVRTR